MVRFSKKNYFKALEVANLCISDEYDINMTYEEFRTQLKQDRESGLIDYCGFKLDLRKNILMDSLEEEFLNGD